MIHTGLPGWPAAAEGLGCDHCERGVPITFVDSRAGGRTALCLGCTIAWFPARTVEWWEARHRPMSDHLGDRLDAAELIERRERVAMESAT